MADQPHGTASADDLAPAASTASFNDILPDAPPAAPLKPSDLLPHPAQVDQQTTANARALAEAATRPGHGVMAPYQPSLWDRITAPIREGAIGRAFGVSSETAEARREDPGNPVVRMEAALPPGSRGVTRGVAEFTSGLTTPENMLLMAGSGGLGAMEGQLGKQTLSKLLSLGFSSQMVWDALRSAPEFAAAAKAGDWATARQILTKAGLSAGMAAVGVKHAGTRETPVPEVSDSMRQAAAEPPRPNAPHGASNSQYVNNDALSTLASIETDPHKRTLIERAARERGVPVNPPERQSAQLSAETLEQIPAEQPKEQAAPPAKPAEPARVPGAAEQSAAVFERARRAQEQQADARAKKQSASVPETGVPEQVARVQDARERLAQQLAGKPWSELNNGDRQAIDQFVREGYMGGGGPPEETKPNELQQQQQRQQPPVERSKPVQAKEQQQPRLAKAEDIVAGGPQPGEQPEEPAAPAAPAAVAEAQQTVAEPQQAAAPAQNPANAASVSPLSEPPAAPAAAPPQPEPPASQEPPAASPANPDTVAPLAESQQQPGAAAGEDEPRPITPAPPEIQPRNPATAPAYGREVPVAVPGEPTTYRSRYAVRELEDVYPSHNGISFQPNENYDYQNDRDYEHNTALKDLVIERGKPERYDANFTTMESPTAEHGAPVVDRRGNVLGGNSRAMTQARIYDPETEPTGGPAAAYKQSLRDRAQTHGIDPAELDRFKRPVLTRELLQTPGEEAAQRMITDFNKTGAAKLAPEEQAVADGHRMSGDTVREIAAKLSDVGEDSTLAQALQGEGGVDVINRLVKDGVLTKQEAAGLTDDRDMLTAQAKDRIAKALVGRLFERPAQFTAAPPELRNKLERVAPHVLRVEADPAWNVTPTVREALTALEEARAHGTRNLYDLVNQPDFSGHVSDYSEQALGVANTLRQGPLKAAGAFRRYANDHDMATGEQVSFFKPPTREEAFQDAFLPAAADKGKVSKQLADFATDESGTSRMGVDKFWRDDVAPRISGAARAVLGTADDILKVLAPQLRSPSAQRAGLVLRNRLSELAHRYDRAEASLREAKRAFDRLDDSDAHEFIRRMEAGQPQAAPEFDAVAGVLRKMLDGRRGDVQALGTGKLQSFYENYFPHIWKDAKKAADVFKAFFGRAPLEGGKSFLKKRTLPTFEDGLKAGLEPVSQNPVDLAMLKVREMDRYIMAHQTLNEWKQSGLARFVDARDTQAQQKMKSSGWRQIQDPMATVHGPSVQNITEYPNEGTWRGLQTAANALGLRQERGFMNLQGAVGRANQGSGRVQTLHGTAEDVLAHEIGHQIDWLAGSGKRFVLEYPDPATVARLKRAYATLKDVQGTTLDQRRSAREELKSLAPAISQRKEFAGQLRALADQRSGNPAYTHKREEKMALLAEMWVGSRELFERTAPKVYGEWKQFLDQNPKLHGLRDIEGNTEVTPISQPYDVGGLVVKGHYWAPDGAARILDNYLTPGLRAKSGAYRALLGANNVLNQAQLGLSAFHAGFTSADAAVSKGAIAIEQLLRGKPLAALKSAAQVPIAPLTTAIQGNKVLREWYSPGSQGAPIAAIVDALEKGGGRVRMDEFYQTHIGEQMARAFRRGNVLGGLIRAPFAGVEGLGNVIMRELVPRQKLGVFADLARLEMEKLGPGATVEQTRSAMAKAWDSVENRMGQMTYDNLFWNRTAKDLAMLGVRSVGWNLGTIREIGGAGLDAAKLPLKLATGKLSTVNPHRLAYVASLALTSAAMGAMYQYLATGKGPEELKDYFFPKSGELDEAGRPQRMSMPTYVKDVYHYATEPGKTLAGKVSPLASLVAEMARNEDFYGTKIRNQDDPLVQQMLDSVKHVARSAEPFGVRNYERETKLQAPAGQRAQQFAGITPAPAALEKSRAELLASDLAHAGVPGGRTREQAARAEEEHTIGRLARTGKPTGPEIARALRAGTISVQGARQALANARVDPLARTFRGLPLDQALRVWEVATPAEKQRLRALLAQKGRSLAQKSAGERAALMPRLAQALRP